MLKRNWSVRNEVIKRVQREAEVEFWEKYKQGELPKYQKCENIKMSPGWINLLKELKP